MHNLSSPFVHVLKPAAYNPKFIEIQLLTWQGNHNFAVPSTGLTHTELLEALNLCLKIHSFHNTRISVHSTTINNVLILCIHESESSLSGWRKGFSGLNLTPHLHLPHQLSSAHVRWNSAVEHVPGARYLARSWYKRGVRFWLWLRGGDRPKETDVSEMYLQFESRHRGWGGGESQKVPRDSL